MRGCAIDALQSVVRAFTANRVSLSDIALGVTADRLRLPARQPQRVAGASAYAFPNSVSEPALSLRLQFVDHGYQA
jgi:hypothetical protein